MLSTPKYLFFHGKTGRAKSFYRKKAEFSKTRPFYFHKNANRYALRTPAERAALYTKTADEKFLVNTHKFGHIYINNMIQETTSNHSFIVKVWCEETNEGPYQSVWRGRVTHVPSHEQRYFQDLKDLVNFIEHYIQPCDGDAISPDFLATNLQG